MKQACEEMRGPVVQKVDNSIHRINLYLVDLAIGFVTLIRRIGTYPVDTLFTG